MPPELLSPAGGFDAALAAFQYGADAVYLGLPRFSARAEADNMTPERLRTLLAYARSFSPAKKIYVTFNTLVLDGELAQAIDTLDTLDELAPDGVIVQDLGVARLVRDSFPKLALHASTQLAAHNLDGVLALKALGFTRVVLARELTLDEIRHIVSESGVEIEIFVHGALCYGFSGLCLFSSQTAGRSGNRGRCAYCCREAFTAPPTSDSRPPTCDLRPPASYPFSMKDLALAPLFDAVVASGAHSLKIEGRMKSPLYVACVTDYYRRKLDGGLTPDTERTLVQDLQTVFSRPWTTLYAGGADAAPDTVIDPVGIGHRGAPIGRAEALFRDRDGTSWLRFTSNRALEKHDGLQVELPEGGKPFGCAVHLLRAAGTQRTAIALPAGTTVEVALPAADVPAIPRGAPVFCSASQAVRRRYEIQNLRESALPSGPQADIRVALAPEGLAVRAETAFERPGDVAAETVLPLTLTPSRQPEQTAAAVRKAFERIGETSWQLGSLTLDDPHALYAPPSKLNEARRAVLDALTSEWEARRASRRAALTAAWTASDDPSRAATPAPAAWTLKLRCGSPLLPAGALDGIGTLVLAIGHTPLSTLEQQLDGWTALVGAGAIRLALPLLSREHERTHLKATVQVLAQRGWADWECADLAGHHLLRACGLTPRSADWSLYALNRVAVAELAALGFRSFVLSPESNPDNTRDLVSALRPPPIPELLVYQHTPLFISETAPCLPLAADGAPTALADRRGRTFFTQRIDNRWCTVRSSARHLADLHTDTGICAFRIDFSWSPPPDRFAPLLRTLLSDRCPTDATADNRAC